MKLSDEEQNRIRCSVALSVPVVLDYLSSPTEIKYDEVRHMLPTYELTGMDPIKVLPYFTPWDLKDQGKKRIYVNANGYRIRYITYSMLNRFRDDLRKTLEKNNPDGNISLMFEREMSHIGGNWVIMKGDLKSKKTWQDLKSSIIATEVRPMADNHPPTGPKAWESPLVVSDGMSVCPVLKKYDFRNKLHGEET